MFSSEKTVLVPETILNCFGLRMPRIDAENRLKGGTDALIVLSVSLVSDGIQRFTLPNMGTSWSLYVCEFIFSINSLVAYLLQQEPERNDYDS